MGVKKKRKMFLYKGRLWGFGKIDLTEPKYIYFSRLESPDKGE